MKNTTDLQRLLPKIVNKIKTIIILLILSVGNNIMYCQTLESIKGTDTVYIYFDSQLKHTSKERQVNTQKSVFYENYFTYRFNTNSMNTILFLSNTYKDYDDMREGIKNDERIEKKSFLKKNKDIILDYAFFERYGFKETFFEIYKKTVYLIDKDEMKGRKIKVKQVDIACFTCFEE